MRARLVLAGSVFTLMVIGCTADTLEGVELSPALDAGAYDGALPVYDAGCVGIAVTGKCNAVDAAGPDAHVPDATVADANLPDTSQPDVNAPDANVPDTNVADTNVPDTSDSNVPDTNVPDTNVPDTNVPDTNIPDTNVPDTNVPDAFDAGCVVNVFGDYYLRTDGTIASMKTSPHSVVYDNTTGQPLKTVTEVVEQADHACALRSDGTVWCWPHTLNSGNSSGDLGNGQVNGNQLAYFATQVVTQPQDAGPEKYLTGVTTLSLRSATGYTFPTCAVRSDKSLWCWGNSTAQGSGPSGLFYGTLGSAASTDHAIPISLSAGVDGGPPPTVTADSICVGDRHACYLDAGKVYCWGSNIAGNLGTGDTNFAAFPVAVMMTLGLPAVVDELSCAYDLTCARAGGKVWCWGTNGANMVGNPDIPPQICNSNYCFPVPTPVEQTLADAGLGHSALTGSTVLTGGYQSTCSLGSAGDIWCWGATVGGVSSVKEATPYYPSSGSAPYTSVSKLSSYGGDINSGLRYLTTGGTLVSGTQVITPVCPP